MNVYDIETFTKNEKIIPYCISYILDGKAKNIYYNEGRNIIISFLDDIIKECEGDVEIFSHNINFDGYVIIEELTKKKIRFEWFIRELNLYWVDIFFLKIKIRLRCSYKIIPLSLGKIGEMVGIKKKIFPYRFSSIENLQYIGECPTIYLFDGITNKEYEEYLKENSPFNFKKISIDYCNNDVLILFEVLKNILKIIDKYDKNIWKKSFSFSSIAYKIFKKIFDKSDICSYSIDAYEKDYIKRSYYGGRCEVFGNPLDEEIVHHFDFSGMYAQCMMNLYPIGFPSFKKEDLSIKDFGLHSVRVSSDMKIPILPCKYGNKLYFLNGELEGVFSSIELELFVSHGGVILDHYSSYVYKNCDYVFSNFVEEFNNIRKKGIYYNIFGKSMNNGLYGSFALTEDSEEYIIIYSEEELSSYIENTDVKSWKKVNNCIILSITKNYKSKKFLDKNRKWSKEIRRNLIYASFISSYARIKLYRGFLEIEKNNGRLYYCDTDSFFAGFKENNVDKRMGEIVWSDIYEDAVFICPKFYYIKNAEKEIFKSKGVRNNKHTFEKIKKDFYENKNLISFKEQFSISRKDYIISQTYLEKRISIGSYDKRIFKENKKETTAFSFRDIQTHTLN